MDMLIGAGVMYIIVAVYVFPVVWESKHPYSRIFVIVKPFLNFMQSVFHIVTPQLMFSTSVEVT